MAAQVAERRRHRRVELPAAHVDVSGQTAGNARSVSGWTRNVSLAGCSATMPASFPWRSGDAVSCTVTVSDTQSKHFPFVRLVASGYVVRVQPTAPHGRRGSDRPATGAEAGSVAEPGERQAHDLDVAIAFSDIVPLATTSGF